MQRPVRPDLHRYLLDALDDRHETDYDEAAQFTAEQAGEQIARAEEFLSEVESYPQTHPDEDTDG